MAQTPLDRDMCNMVPPMVMDRRGKNRIPNPPCPTCRADADHVRVTTRTASRLYYKCDKCGGVWDGEMPARWTRQSPSAHKTFRR
jgi:transposase-like protein